jgi:hypothetical protein
MIAEQTKKMITRVSVFFVLFLGISLGILLPTLLNIKKTADESYKLRLLLEQKYEQSLRSRVTKQKLNEVKQIIADFDKYIFKTGDELKLITFLENLANKHALTQTISNSNLDKLGADRMAEITLSLAGDYQNTLEYIADLEISDYFITIEQLQIKPVFNKNGETSKAVTLDLTTKLYVNK